MNRLLWAVVKIIGLAAWGLGYCMIVLLRPNPCKRDEYDSFFTSYSLYFVGQMIYFSNGPEDLPAIVSERLLMMAKIVLLICAFGALSDLVTALKGMI